MVNKESSLRDAQKLWEADRENKRVIFRYDRAKVDCRVCGGNEGRSGCIKCAGKGQHKVGVGGSNWHSEAYWLRFTEFAFCE